MGAGLLRYKKTSRPYDDESKIPGLASHAVPQLEEIDSLRSQDLSTEPRTKGAYTHDDT